MKNKKGFTIVELLGVIVILGLLLLIGIPTIRNYLRRSQDVYYSSLEKNMMSASGEYMNTYRTLLPRVIGHTAVLSLSELESNSYIDKVVDENGDKCIGQVIVKKKKTDSYEYISCLKCGTRYITENDTCIIDEDSDTGFKNNELDNLYEDSDEYRIVVEYDEYEVAQTEEFIIPEARVEHLENGVWKRIEAKPIVSTKKVNTNTLDTKTVTYSYHGAKASIKVKIVDKVAPTKPEVVIKYNNSKGNNYQGNWYSGQLYVEYKSTDYTKKNVIGSGIKNYEYSLDGTTWTEVRKNNDPSLEYSDWNIIKSNASSNPIIPGDGEYNISVRAVDKAGNTSEVSVYNIKIDTHAPECAIKVISGTPGLENWYKTAITVGYDLSVIDGTTSSIISSPIKVTKADGTAFPYTAIAGTPGNNKVEITQPGENLRIYGTLTDQAGNVTVCETQGLDESNRVKLDPTIPNAPTITAHDGNTTGTWHNKANTDGNNGNVTLTFSGANNLSKNIYYYRIDGEVLVNTEERAINANDVFDNRLVAAKNIKVDHGTDTASTMYYAITCSVAGNCSANAIYEVKLDKSVPNVPTSIIRKTNSSGEVVSNENKWRNFNIWWGSFTAADNGPAGIDHYEYSDNCSGNKTNDLDTSYTYTNGIDYKYCIRSVDKVGNVSSWSDAYYFKVDTTTPTITAKKAEQIVPKGSTAATKDYFTATAKGKSGVSVTCTKESIDKMNNVETVSCTATSGAGNSSTPASTTFKKYVGANENKCRNDSFPCEKHKSCRAAVCGKEYYNCSAKCPSGMNQVGGNGDFGGGCSKPSDSVNCAPSQGLSETSWTSGSCECSSRNKSCVNDSCECELHVEQTNGSVCGWNCDGIDNTYNSGDKCIYSK